VTPQRFVDPLIRERLDPVTDIPGLYMTGQDTVLCGVTLCQVKYEASVSVLCFWFNFQISYVIYGSSSNMFHHCGLQLSGVITALRMEGVCAAVKILLQAIFA
jgi:hypothetical protein